MLILLVPPGTLLNAWWRILLYFAIVYLPFGWSIHLTKSWSLILLSVVATLLLLFGTFLCHSRVRWLFLRGTPVCRGGAVLIGYWSSQDLVLTEGLSIVVSVLVILRVDLLNAWIVTAYLISVKLAGRRVHKMLFRGYRVLSRLQHGCKEDVLWFMHTVA